MMKRVLIAIEADPSGEAVLKFGHRFAKQIGASDIAVASVIDPTLLLVDGATVTEMRASFKGEIQKLLDFSNSEHHFVLEGEPAKMVVEAAEDWRADVIVLGSHSRARVTHFFLGSVAEKITRYAPCPVLIVPRKFLVA